MRTTRPSKPTELRAGSTPTFARSEVSGDAPLGTGGLQGSARSRLETRGGSRRSPRSARESQSFIHPRAPSHRERLLSPPERNLPNSITDPPGEKSTEGAPDRPECRLRGPGTRGHSQRREARRSLPSEERAQTVTDLEALLKGRRPTRQPAAAAGTPQAEPLGGGGIAPQRPAEAGGPG